MAYIFKCEEMREIEIWYSPGNRKLSFVEHHLHKNDLIKKVTVYIKEK